MKLNNYCIKSVVEDISTYYECVVPDHKYYIGYNKETTDHVLIIKTELVDFLLSGLKESNQKDEEHKTLESQQLLFQPFL